MFVCNICIWIQISTINKRPELHKKKMLGASRPQASIWINSHIYWDIYDSLGLNELNLTVEDNSWKIIFKLNTR